MPQYQNNFHARHRFRHDAARENPNRENILLRQAITDAGLEVVGWEHECWDPPTPPVWYNAVVRVQGQECAIFFWNKWVYPSLPMHVRARQRKIDYAKAHSMPFIEIRGSNLNLIRAQIEKWLMTKRTNPYQEAPPKGRAWRQQEQAQRGPERVKNGSRRERVA